MRLKDRKITPWWRLDLKPFDQLICAGSSWASRGIQLYQRAGGKKGPAVWMSHVAQIAPRSLCFGADSGCVFESTTGNVKWSGESGVQVNPFGQWLDHYNGMVFVRQLTVTMRVTTTRYGPEIERLAMIQAYKDFIRETIGTPYENGIPGLWELAMCNVPYPDFFPQKWRRKPTSDPHCTENNVRSLQLPDVGIADPKVDANKMPPCEFWPGGRFEKALLPHVKIGDPIRIK